MTSKAAIAQPGWPVVVDTKSPSPTGTNATVTFMNACLTAKTISFIQSPTSIKAANGFKYTTQRGDLMIELGAKSDAEFATALADAISEHGALHAADPHYIGNAVVTIWLIKVLCLRMLVFFTAQYLLLLLLQGRIFVGAHLPEYATNS